MYNYKLPDGEQDPKYMMSVAIPGFTKALFGLSSGLAYAIPFSTVVLFAGVASDNCSRRVLLGVAGMLWSVTSITIAFSQNTTEVLASRTMLGFFEAFCGPPALSLIADYFPPETRTTPLSVYNLGVIGGQGLSSLIIVSIKYYGWRATYLTIGIGGVAVGLFCLIFIVDPIRGRFEPRKPKVIDEDAELVQRERSLCCGLLSRYGGGFYEMATNRTCLFVVLGASLRFW